MKYNIRLAKENDILGLCNIRDNYELFTKYLNQHQNKDMYLIIAEQNEDILGFGVLKLKGSLIPKLSDLYVKEIYRGMGIGSDIIKYREEMVRDLGYTQLFVSVDPIENPRMVSLIKRHGYDPISEPYLKTAIYYNEDGTTYDKTYSRMDFKK